MFRTSKSMIKFLKDTVDTNLFEPIIHKIKLNNLQHIDRIEISIYNPSTVSQFSTFRKTIFCTKIHFEKNNLQVSKEILNNEPTELIKEIDNFLNNEIKI